MKSKYKKIKLPDGSTRDEHRLIMEAVLGRRLMRGEVVHHIDGNGRNNTIGNLTVKSLSEHSREHSKGRLCGNSARIKIGMAHAKLTAEQVRLIRVRYEFGATIVNLAHEFSVSWNAVKDIIARRSWRFLD